VFEFEVGKLVGMLPRRVGVSVSRKDKQRKIIKNFVTFVCIMF